MVNDEVKISFCIPIHNGRQYIRSCIESIIRQKIDRFEIICVDDQSTDGSYEELVQLQKAYPQMCVLRNKTNKGVSFSRNAAIRAAKGMYVWFIDSDDLLMDNAAIHFYNIGIENSAEAILGKCYSFHEETLPDHIDQRSGAVARAIPDNPKLFYQTDQFGNRCYGIWLGIYKRSFLLENNLFFHEELSLLEDVTFYFELSIKAKKVFMTDYYGYLYRVRKSSLSHGGGDILRKRYFEAYFKVLTVLSKYPKEGNEKNKEFIDSYIAYCQCRAIVFLYRICDNQYVSAGISEMKRQGFYPYKYINKIDHRKSEEESILLYKAMSIEPVFWIIHHAFVRFRRK